MANTRKPKAQTPGPSRKRTTRPAEARAPELEASQAEALTPDWLRRQWELQHPGRPEVRAALERLYRQRY